MTSVATINRVGTVLLIDDDDHLRFVLTAHLRSHGFEVFDAENGRAGLELAREYLPDLIITDVTMPELDGLAVTKELKSDPRTAAIPVILLTARHGTDNLVRGFEIGAQEYLTKPFEVAELLARVRTVHRLALARREVDQLNDSLEQEVSRKTQRLQLLYDFMRDLSQARTRGEVLDLIIQYVQRTTGANRISLMMTDATGENLVCERAVGIDQAVVKNIRVDVTRGIAGQVYQSGKTMIAKAVNPGAPDGRGYDGEEFLSTPVVSASLESHDGVLGVLNVTERSNDEPFSAEELEGIRSITDASAIALHNILRRTQLEHSVRELLQTVGFLAEYRDEETTLHLKRVAKFARILAEQLAYEGPYREEVNGEFVEQLVQAAPMHDIGKVGIPDDILTKPGKLTDAEFDIMKTHTEIGRRVLSRAADPKQPVPLLQMCIDIAYCHHERFNGRGYPRGLGGRDIPLSARIIALVDAYDAITSYRRYSPAKPHELAAKIVREEAGEHFDPILVEAFLRCEREFDAVREQYGESPEDEAQDQAQATAPALVTSTPS